MEILYDFNTTYQRPLELQESIEMLRAIQHGYKVRMVISQKTKSVDCEQDRLDVENLMKDDNFYKLYKKNE